jgi:hypothetical protein
MFPLFLIEIIENHCVFCIFCDFCMFFVFFIEHIANFGVRNGWKSSARVEMSVSAGRPAGRIQLVGRARVNFWDKWQL